MAALVAVAGAVVALIAAERDSGQRLEADSRAARERILAQTRVFQVWGDERHPAIEAAMAASDARDLMLLVARAGEAAGVARVDVTDTKGGLVTGWPSDRSAIGYGPPDDMPDKRHQGARLQVAGDRMFYNRMLLGERGVWIGNLRMAARLGSFQPGERAVLDDTPR